MKTSFIINKKIRKTRRRLKLLAALVFTLIAVAGTFKQAIAQRNNASDWAVPPPLPPGNTTKGVTTGRDAKVKPIVLTLTDIPAAQLPNTQPVQVPNLSVIATSPPLVNSPGQPRIQGFDDGLPEIPLPAPPDAPPLPKQLLHDTPTPSIADLPVIAAPEMPAFPREPIPAGQTTIKMSIPVMPDVASLSSPSLHTAGPLTYWSTPGIPENISFKVTAPAGKGTHKAKSSLLKN